MKPTTCIFCRIISLLYTFSIKRICLQNTTNQSKITEWNTRPIFCQRAADSRTWHQISQTQQISAKCSRSSAARPDSKTTDPQPKLQIPGTTAAAGLNQQQQASATKPVVVNTKARLLPNLPPPSSMPHLRASFHSRGGQPKPSSNWQTQSAPLSNTAETGLCQQQQTSSKPQIFSPKLQIPGS